MKKKLAFSLFIVCMNTICFGQNVFTLIEKNVGLLRYSFKDTVDHTVIGTGTIIGKPLNSKGDSAWIFLVTNKHVLPSFSKSKDIEFLISSPDSSTNSFITIKIPIYQADGKYDPRVILSKDEDLAVIEIDKEFVESGLNSFKQHATIGIDFLATKQVLKSKQIGIGDMVFFQGYPSFFYDENNISPIFRTGYIATDPTKPFYFSSFLKMYFTRNILNGFLIDGNVFGGSSGSLVCLYPTLINQSSQYHPELTNKKVQAWILGILTESYFDIGTEVPYSQRVNIGGVISSDKILELINSYK